MIEEDFVEADPAEAAVVLAGVALLIALAAVVVVAGAAE